MRSSRKLRRVSEVPRGRSCAGSPDPEVVQVQPPGQRLSHNVDGSYKVGVVLRERVGPRRECQLRRIRTDLASRVWTIVTATTACRRSSTLRGCSPARKRSRLRSESTDLLYEPGNVLAGVRYEVEIGG